MPNSQHDHHQGPGLRIPISPLVLGIRCERETLRRKITDRLEARLAAGMIDEVRALHEKGLGWERIDSFGLEYRYIGLYLQGKITREEMFRILNTRIHQFAKRQETWFRRMEKNGVRIHWIESDDTGNVDRPDRPLDGMNVHKSAKNISEPMGFSGSDPLLRRLSRGLSRQS